MFATLKNPYRGYKRIELIEKLEYTWLARIICSGEEINVFDYEFEIDTN